MSTGAVLWNAQRVKNAFLESGDICKTDCSKPIKDCKKASNSYQQNKTLVTITV